MTTSLTGVWDGTFIQPGVGAITFLATLIEAGGALAGSVTEPCVSPGYTHVFYEGAVNAEATEIDGRWKLPDNSAAGTFLMIRSGKPAEAVAVDQQVKEPAR
jgi:hypothetical protein